MVSMIATKSFRFRGEQVNVNDRIEASDERTALKLVHMKRAKYSTRMMTADQTGEGRPTNPQTPAPAAAKKTAKKKTKPGKNPQYQTRDMSAKD